jgi:hypothetical protein
MFEEIELALICPSQQGQLSQIHEWEPEAHGLLGVLEYVQ